MINTMMQQFTKAIGDVVEGKLSAFSTRLDALEASFTGNVGVEMTPSGHSSASSKGQMAQFMVQLKLLHESCLNSSKKRKK